MPAFPRLPGNDVFAAPKPSLKHPPALPPVKSPTTPKTPAPIPPEIYVLAERKFAGAISREDHARLEALLLESPEARRYYLSLSAVDADLPVALQMRREADARNASANRTRFIRRAAFAIGAAAVIALVAATAFHQGAATNTPALADNDDSEAPFCRVSQAVDASAAGKYIDPGTELKTKTFAIDTGVAELVFRKGARVLLEAPAALEITGANSCRLLYGKAVADVPDSAKGFIVETAQDRIVDYGTRFALDVAKDGTRTRLGVLSGIVDLERDNHKVRLFTDYAVETGNGKIISVPFIREDFLTEMPTQEFWWNLDGKPFEKINTLRFDVTRLVQTPGDMHLLFKRLLGKNGLWVKKISLERNGTVVMASVADRHFGQIQYTRDNFFPLQIPDDTPRTGKWELVVECTCTRHKTGRLMQPPGSTIESQGIFRIEKNLLKNAGAPDFVGRWQYSHDEKTYINEFKANGTMAMFINGKQRDFGDNPPVWTVKDGICTIDFRRVDWFPLKMVLRNSNTMIFVNQTFRNAHRIE